MALGKIELGKFSCNQNKTFYQKLLNRKYKKMNNEIEEKYTVSSLTLKSLI